MARDMAGERDHAAGDGPDVQVVNRRNAGRASQHLADLIDVQMSRCGFEPYVHRLPQQRPGRGQHQHGDYRGGEALFVPKENSNAEDDGYLIDLLSHEEKSYLLIIDASSMEELAKLHIPQRVPYGVHACWLDENKISTLGNNY